jgi:hypothetical protein
MQVYAQNQSKTCLHGKLLAWFKEDELSVIIAAMLKL